MNKIISTNDVVSQVESNIVSDMDGEKVMLSIENGKYYNLGDTGGEIWECMKEPISIQDLINTLVMKYDVGEQICRDQVIGFIDSLRVQGLVKIEST
ncbi:PqqD family protein [Virgibacillus profundi]|uniref:PqqD family protein n=1 Tax=Virgibacillus profundi TaxID=2024555 RepID=A0A2A2IIR9_9BACI|nr:lasso peptide biosynthesis PqqD family chaperone [Virgibacillus profundi]PAV31527.1 PqqD family protein [Virgibacillus profundi]PXY55713.1 lasso peptide biosynthesis PqqD family chaperone [Virgibacillus profundi]